RNEDAMLPAIWLGDILRTPLDRAGEEGIAEFDRERGSALRKLRILERKRRRCFRPDEQIDGMALRRDAELVELEQIGNVKREPVGGIRLNFGEIQLHGASGVVRM